MQRLAVVLVAATLFANCGSGPVTPTSQPTLSTSTTTVRTLTVTIPTAPFHVSTAGDIVYQVTGAGSLASLAYATDDGTASFGAIMAPASAVGTLHITFKRAGTFSVRVTAMTTAGTTLEVTTLVTVVE